MLRFWLGQKFGQEAAPIAQLLLLGIWINGLGLVPFTLLQSQGRPDIVAKFHAAQLIPFILMLWFLLNSMGLVGAALAWSIRVSIDTGMLFWATGLGYERVKAILPGAAVVLSSWFLAVLLAPPPIIAFVLALGLSIAIGLWMAFRDPVVAVLLGKLHPVRICSSIKNRQSNTKESEV
jgi:O-antigen/teichoic acid export membrane protein